MTIQPKPSIFGLATYLGLRVEYASDLPTEARGCLGPGDEPLFIVVNANQPIFEQRFTIAHELAHYVLHHNRPRRSYFPWFLKRKWTLRPLDEISRHTRRAFPVIFDKEWEANIWAIVMLFHFGDMRTLMPYLKHHPKKIPWFLVALFLSLFRLLLRPFQLAFQGLSRLFSYLEC